MKANIGFKNLEVSCVIGVYPEERVKEQTILVDVSVAYNIAPAADSDDINKAVSYVEIAEYVEISAKEGKYELIETLVKVCLEGILNKYPSVEIARIKVKKPSAIESAEYTFTEAELFR